LKQLFSGRICIFGQRLARKSELQFLKIVININFFETNEPTAVIFTVRFIWFEDSCINGGEKIKKLPVVFLWAELTALLSLSL
jgi:hypothetical protein